MATITGVGGTGSVGALSIQGQIIVSLLSDSSGTPGSLIAVLGVFNDADLVLGTSILEIVLALPITLTPNTRYWIQVSGNGITSYSWVQAGDDTGAGVADEFWYENDSGTITTGSNSDGPSFQMAVLSEPSTGVFGATEAGDPTTAIVLTLASVAATGTIASVRPQVIVDVVGVAASGAAGDPVVSFAQIAQPIGVHGTGEVGTITIPGKLVVSLLSDSDGSPGSLIAVLGVYEDADLALGTIILEIDLSLAPLALTPNTRYWIEVAGNAFTSYSWVEAADDSGSGVATELWYQDVDGSVSTGANSLGPSFQMEVLGEPPTGVYATGGVGFINVEVDATISGVTATGAVGLITIPGQVDQPVTGVSAHGYSGAVSTAIDSNVSGVEASGQIGTITSEVTVAPIGVEATGVAVAVVTPEAGTITGAASTSVVQPFTIDIDQLLAVVTATGFAGAITTTVTVSAVNVPITGVEGSGQAGKPTTSRPKRLRGGRGAPRYTDPTPAELERTEAERMRRWRQIVDDLLGLEPKEEREKPAEQPDDDQDFSFITSLPKGPESDEDAAEVAAPIEPEPPKPNKWREMAEAEDLLLLGDMLGETDQREADDILLLGDLL